MARRDAPAGRLVSAKARLRPGLAHRPGGTRAWATAPELAFPGWSQGYREGLHGTFWFVPDAVGTVYRLGAFGTGWTVYAP